MRVEGAMRVVSPQRIGDSGRRWEGSRLRVPTVRVGEVLMTVGRKRS
jgi:hypothetical protein